MMTNPYAAWVLTLDARTLQRAARELASIQEAAEPSGGTATAHGTPEVFRAARRVGDLPRTVVDGGVGVHLPRRHLDLLTACLPAPSPIEMSSDASMYVDGYRVMNAARYDGPCTTCRRLMRAGIPIFELPAGWSCYACDLQHRASGSDDAWGTGVAEAA